MENLNKEKCCENCKKDKGLMTVCLFDGNCSCHQEKPKEDNCICDKYHKQNESFTCKKHGLMQSIGEDYTTPTSDWETKLENDFSDMLNLVETQTGESERSRLKSFIQEVRIQLLQEIIDWLHSETELQENGKSAEGKSIMVRGKKTVFRLVDLLEFIKSKK